MINRMQQLLYLFTFLACSLWATTFAYCGELSEAQVQDLFSQGKEAFRQANAANDKDKAKKLYQKAVMHFELITENGTANGKLYYNIGNAYFRMRDLGRAILNYRRAEQFIPNDPQLYQNLQYARSRCLDEVKVKPETQVLKAILFFHYDFSTRTRSLSFAILSILFWLGMTIRLFKKIVPRWLLTILCLCTVLLFGSLITEAILAQKTAQGVILENEIIARKGDGNNFQPSFKEPLHQGTEFTLIETRKNWLQVELADGRSCWVPVKAVGLLSPSQGSTTSN